MTSTQKPEVVVRKESPLPLYVDTCYAVEVDGEVVGHVASIRLASGTKWQWNLLGKTVQPGGARRKDAVAALLHALNEEG